MLDPLRTDWSAIAPLVGFGPMERTAAGFRATTEAGPIEVSAFMPDIFRLTQAQSAALCPRERWLARGLGGFRGRTPCGIRGRRVGLSWHNGKRHACPVWMWSIGSAQRCRVGRQAGVRRASWAIFQPPGDNGGLGPGCQIRSRLTEGTPVWEDFILFVAVGFAAQLVGGAIGMAYGLSATTVMLSVGMASRGSTA